MINILKWLKNKFCRRISKDARERIYARSQANCQENSQNQSLDPFDLSYRTKMLTQAEREKILKRASDWRRR